MTPANFHPGLRFKYNIKLEDMKQIKVKVNYIWIQYRTAMEIPHNTKFSYYHKNKLTCLFMQKYPHHLMCFLKLQGELK